MSVAGEIGANANYIGGDVTDPADRQTAVDQAADRATRGSG